MAHVAAIEWTLLETETTASRNVVFIIKADATVTMGKFSCSVKTQDGTFTLKMPDQFGEVMFDLQSIAAICATGPHFVAHIAKREQPFGQQERRCLKNLYVLNRASNSSVRILLVLRP